jgi:hypothetical protein
MNNLKYSIFDLFSFAIPGTLLLACIGLSCNVDLFQKSDFSILHYVTEKFSLQVSVIYLILSYIIGYISSIISNYYQKIFEFILPDKKPKHSSLANSTKLVLLREFTPTNAKYIEKWNSLKSMSSNLAFVILIGNIIIKIYYTEYCFIFVLIGFGISVLLNITSHRYREWAIIESDNAIHYFGLDTDPAKLFETKLKN